MCLVRGPNFGPAENKRKEGMHDASHRESISEVQGGGLEQL
jgi:hypothetical protein